MCGDRHADTPSKTDAREPDPAVKRWGVPRQGAVLPPRQHCHR